MKIKIYTSNTLNGACSLVIDALGRQNTAGSRHIVIVPDKFSLSIEKEIFIRLGIEASFNIDVVSFMRLSAKYQSNPTECLSKSGALLVFKKVLNRHASSLRHYGRVARLPGFASEMYAVITSFRNNCHSPEAIRMAVEKLPQDSPTRRKAEDIALLYKEYIKELAQGYGDGTTRMDEFVKKAPELDILHESHVYIAGFSSFTAKQYQIIAALMKVSKSLTIAATPGNGGENADFYPYSTLRRLTELAEEENSPADVVASSECLKEPFGTINRYLFSAKEVRTPPNPGAFAVFEENTVYDEINGIAKEIARLVATDGLRYRDIAVVSCNDSHAELIRSIFGRYRIPCFVDKKYKLTDSLCYKYLFSALETAEYNLRRDKLLDFAKNPLCGLTYDEADNLENYVLAHSINYRGFLSPFEEEESENERRKIIAILTEINIGTQTAGTFSKTCRRLMERDGLKKLLEEESSLSGDVDIHASNMQAYDALLSLLDEIETRIGTETYSFGECKNILAACAEGEAFSLIPQCADCVFVGNIKDSRYDNLDILFVMDATADVLPAAHDYKAILSAGDFVFLEESGLRLFPAPADQIAEDLFFLLDLFTKAKQHIYFGYARLSPAGILQRPSPVFGELVNLLSIKPISLSAQNSVLKAKSAEALALAVVSEENAFFEFLQGVKKASFSGDLATQNLDILYSSLPENLRERAEGLFHPADAEKKVDGGLYFSSDGNGRYYTKATQLETYFACPYLHHLRYGLDLRPRPEGRLEPMDAGIILHKVLELFFKRTKGKLREMNEEQIFSYSERAIEDVFSDPAYGGRFGDIFARFSLSVLRKNCRRILPALAEQVRHSKYSPYLIEYVFDQNEAILIQAGDRTFFVRGKIDRADLLTEDGKRKIMIIDYKSGGKDNPDYKNTYFGENLQLWIYLEALRREGYCPTGTFYLPLSGSKDGEEYPYRLKGFFDANEIFNFDTGIASLKGNKYVSSVLGSTPSGKLKTSVSAEEIGKLIDYNIALTKQALTEISEGNTQRSPWNTGMCERCIYLQLCGGAQPHECRDKTSSGIPLGKEEQDA